MSNLIGDKKLVAFEIQTRAENLNNSLHIDLWVDDHPITKVDNLAYVPSYYSHLSKEVEKLQRESYENEMLHGLNDLEVFKRLDYEGGEFHKVLSYDDSINSAIIYYYTVGELSRLVYSFVDPRYEPKEELGLVRSINVDKKYLIDVLQEMLERLSVTI